jgi:hypothetical protein
MPKGASWTKPVALILLAGGLASCPTWCSAADDAAARARTATAADPGLYVKVRLSNPVRTSKLKPGDGVEGTLSRDVYSADRKLFPSGSGVRLTVDHLEKRKRIPNDHWPWVVKVFTPRRENYPVFKNATVAQGNSETRLQVSLVSISRMREVHAKAKTKKSGQPSGTDNGAVQVSQPNAKKPATSTMVLEAFGIGDVPFTDNGPSGTASNHVDRNDVDRSETLPAGTRCKILLLGEVSASKSKPGDVVQARLIEPVLLNSKVVLPAGSMVEGRVIRKTPPRWLSRAGSLYLTFTEVHLPGGQQLPIAASLAGAELDEKSHTKMDAEGRLHGERPGKAWMAINLGMTAGIAKEVDDGLQLVIELIVSTATDISTAGTARIAASCASGIYMATRRGRDVVLPRFTEMDISMDRPLSLDAPSTTAGLVAGK